MKEFIHPTPTALKYVELYVRFGFNMAPFGAHANWILIFKWPKVGWFFLKLLFYNWTQG